MQHTNKTRISLCGIEHVFQLFELIKILT